MKTDFAAQGLSKPADTSRAEWLLDEVNGDFGDEEKVGKVVDYWPTSSAAEALQRELCDLEPGEADFDLKGMPSFFGTVLVLMLRNTRNIVRNPAVLWLRFAMCKLRSNNRPSLSSARPRLLTNCSCLQTWGSPA